MSPLLLGAEEGVGDIKEPVYICLTDSSKMDGSEDSCLLGGNDTNLNSKATELRLGLPGSLSPERDRDHSLNSGKLDEKQLFPVLPFADGKCSVPGTAIFSGSKRGFSDVMVGNWMFPNTNLQPSINVTLPPAVSQSKTTVDAAPKEKVVSEKGVITSNHNQIVSSNKNSDSNPSATKALAVGWPPIRSSRKNLLAKNNDEVDGKPGPDALLVKVSMDGAPYLRKIDLRNYFSYQELSSALEKKFSCFTLRQYGCSGGLETGSLSEIKLKDLLHGSEYVLTYEDSDSDWMLVGDVPWEMFIDACRKLRIMKSSDAIGLAAPRAVKTRDIN